MDNYVRRCTLFAIICLAVWLVFCLFSVVHGNSKLVSASEDLTTQTITEENVHSTSRYRPTKDEAKLPDEGYPEHANAVEPPTMTLSIDGATASIVDLAEVSVKKQAASHISEKPTVVSEEIIETTVENPVYEAEPEPMVIVTIEKTVFYGENRYASITLTDEQNEALARLIYHECRGKGGAAVAETVFNRMLSNEFPSTLEDVVYMSGAFSPAKILWTHEYKELDALERCREIPREVLSGNTYLLPSTDYCYFHAGHATLEGDYEYGGNVFYADYAAHH